MNASVNVVPEANGVQVGDPPTKMAPAHPHPAFSGKLTREEYLEMENLSLKTQNLGMQEQRLQQDLMKSNQMRKELQDRLDTMRSTLSEKYGLNLMAKTTQILDDGVILDMTKTQGPRG